MNWRHTYKGSLDQLDKRMVGRLAKGYKRIERSEKERVNSERPWATVGVTELEGQALWEACAKSNV